VRGGEVELVEKLGRMDPCPCGSGQRFQELLPAIGPVSMGPSGMTIGASEGRGVRAIAISMSRVANPYDNAKAESFMKTLKTEEVNGKAYATIEHARRDIGSFIETVYNAERLHSALGYKPPVEFEAELRQPIKA
jgi:transposase InsO family protein